MGSKGGEDVIISGNDTAECSEATVEIKIKTLDSQTYTLRVDKCLPVPALKDQIATVTGVLSDQQRLICRGRVLKDDQLLSAYHVEDGHTLHLVVRQPIPSPSEGSLHSSATDPASMSGHTQGSQVDPSVVVGSFNISEQGDGVFPDLSRIVSAVLGSFGITNVGGGSEGIDLGEPAPERFPRTTGLGGLRSSSREQAYGAATRDQSNSHYVAVSPSNVVPLEPMQPPIIPDSLTTLSQYLSHVRQEFSASVVRSQNYNSQDAGTYGNQGQDSDTAIHSGVSQGGLPTPAALAEVMLSARQILSEHAAECLLQISRQIGDHVNVTDQSARIRIQSDAIRSGVLLRNLGALLLELGRTTMTLQVGQTPADAVVNAGPAVFISTSGPNPIMVQPLPFQPGANFGTVPLGTVQPGSGLSGGSAGSAFLPRNIDIRIRTGSFMPSTIVSPMAPTGAQPVGQTDHVTSGGGNSADQATAGTIGSSSFTRESGVRVVPIRTVIAAIPAPVGRAPSDSSRGSVGLFYPVIARVQRVTSRNSNTTSVSASSDERQLDNSGQQPIPESTMQQQNAEAPGIGSTYSVDGLQNGQDSSTLVRSGLDQLLRTIFPGEQIHGGDDTSFAEMGAGTDTGSVRTTQVVANPQEAASIAGDEETFFSNLLRQIMPIISQNSSTGSGASSAEDAVTVDDRTMQSSSMQDNSDRGTSSPRGDSPASPPSSKRQKRE